MAKIFKNNELVATLNSLSAALRYINATLEITQVEAMARGYQIKCVRV